MKICDYGCNQEANYHFQNGKWCCSKNIRRCPVIKEKWKKSTYTNRKREILSDNSWKIKSFDNIKDVYWKRQRIINDQNSKCFKCHLDKWFEKPLNLHIHHIDGNNGNWKRENVVALCPNCHSFTDNFSGKNINSGSIKVEDSILIKALIENKSIRQALLQCGLAPKGGNYDRAKRLKYKNPSGGEMADTVDFSNKMSLHMETYEVDPAKSEKPEMVTPS